MTSLFPIAVPTQDYETGRTATIIPVILSGGSGAQLWPVSRETFPKQFAQLLSDRTLLQATALRARDDRCAAPIVVCDQEHRFLVDEQLRAAGVTEARILLEPSARGSAPAIAAAALLAAQDDPNAILWVMSADACIRRAQNLPAMVDASIAAARAGKIVMFGMPPTAPDSGVSYIGIGQTLGLSEAPDACHVDRFVEKPSTDSAAALIASGDFLWNAGMFVTTAQTMLDEMALHAPVMLAAVRDAFAGSRQDIGFVRLDPQTYGQSPALSLGHAVLERTARAAVVPTDLAWSGVGGWNALWALSPKDSAGNAAIGDVMLEDTEDCYIRSDGMLTAVVGLSDVVVVVTKDATLVTHRDKAQDVEKIVARLRKAKRPEAVAHNRCYRPWGFYESLIQGGRFQVKRIVVHPGQKLSLQKHFHRAEHWVVVSGTAVVTRDTEEVFLRENESIYLPLGCIHRLENCGRIPLTLIEVQSGAYLGEDDIVRIEDTYGRS
jgi:mannose-1-phosphate guanylyltransferase/mannose-6-phosphate isomerase